MLPTLELAIVNPQTVVAILVVALCAGVVLRSWFFFWAGLIRKPDPSDRTQSGCGGCANGCKKSANAPQLVELKREGR